MSAPKRRTCSARRFYRTVIQVEVLSEEPIGEPDLEELHRLITDGPCSGCIEKIAEQAVPARRVAKLLIAQGSDPAFFRLTEDGQALDEGV